MSRKVILALFLSAIGLASCRQHGAGTLRKLTPVEVADRAKPATVTVVAEYEASGTVTEVEIDDDKLVSAAGSKVSYGATNEEKLKAVFDTLLTNPAAYLRPGDQQSLKKTIASHGTGVIVTPDGYLLTNAHVVAPDDEDLKKAVVESISELVDEHVDSISRAVTKALPGTEITSDARETFAKVLQEQYVKTADFHFSRDVFAVMSSSRGGSDLENLGKRCEIKKVGTPVPGKDIAVLKIEGSDFPTLPLAESLEDANVGTGTELFIVGYPGAVALDPDFSIPSRLTPSMTIGHVSGVKEMKDGWKVVQTDAAVNPGNSGGPALDDTGQVVGLATFTLKDTQGLNFVVAIDVAREFLASENVQPHESQFTKSYVEALNDYESNRPKRALLEFKSLADIHPESAIVQEFIHKISRSGVHVASSNEHEGGSSGSATMEFHPVPHRSSGRPLIIFAILGGLLGIIVMFVILANR